MKISDIRLTYVKDANSKTWAVHTDALEGIVVQVENIEDAPAKIAKSLQVMLEYKQKQGDYITVIL